MIQVLYLDGSTQALAFSVVEADTRKVWSPSAGAFVAPTPNDSNGKGAAPADALFPLARVGGANWSTFCVGSAAGVPSPAPGRYYAVCVHPAGGGEPVAPPIPATVGPAGPIKGSFAIILN